MPYLGFYFDPTYILVLIGAVLSIIASARVNSTFNKYARVRSMSGMTGAQTAEAILRSRGIYDVQVEHIRGNLTDHYDPSKKVVRLSDSVYSSTSVAADLQEITKLCADLDVPYHIVKTDIGKIIFEYIIFSKYFRKAIQIAKKMVY
mgnify:CR=1 FL=1